MNKISILSLLLACLIFGGCAKMSHLDQLLTLKGLADEQQQMGQQIEAQDKKFELMLDEMNAGTLSGYSHKRKIERKFGGPVYVKTVGEAGYLREVWLYRYATEFFGSDKIYLYFDPDGNLVGSEYFEGSNG